MVAAVAAVAAVRAEPRRRWPARRSATPTRLLDFLDGAGGVETVANAILDTIRSGIDPEVTGDLAVAFEITEEEAVHRWVLASRSDANAATLASGAGAGAASLGVRMSGPDLLRLSLGQLDPIEGVMSGRVVLSGDLEQLGRLGSVFAAPGAAAPAAPAPTVVAAG